MKTRTAAATLALAALAVSVLAATARADLMLVGIDNKVFWDEAGKMVTSPPGKDVVSIIDIKDRENPRIVASLPLINSVFGPPTNLAITPDESLALVASSMDWVKDGEVWKGQPDTKLFVIDLKANPPTLIETVTVGKQPSGLAINRAGTLALVANRADNSISVLTISGKSVKLVDTVAMGEQVASVAISPDGKHALATKFPGHKIAVLDIDGTKVTYNKYDMNVGLWPYNVAITPDGKLALTADNGNSGASDGQIDTVSVIDMEATPVRVVDKVVVGDGPEGLVISPTGTVAAAMILRGNNAPKGTWFRQEAGSVTLMSISGKKVTKVAEAEVGGLPEGAVFSSDGKYLYVGNYMSDSISILKVEGTKLTNTGKTLKLPGHPASMRGPHP
jgi:DNA-binding beta-propeller fold protein YncE